MQIENGKVVSFHYQLFGEDGALIEKTEDQPTLYLHGAGNMISGVEQALAGRAAGEHFEITLGPDQAYGERKEEMTQRVSAKYLRHAGKLRPGMQVPVQTDEGQRWVTVLKVGLKTVDVDANHPLAGRTLRFVIDVVDVRDATEEEVSHGHAHGPGGHHHH
ncbi:peptidyl-prolyl cis-trans isomerase [Alcanivorax sp. S71-1-4]|jgi:FKBP-type peptidyl-prolyl cis-trans isomerase SlyD|uniref:FKBP-type peptidyl-prolyl cis-trans isomerase n=1 Tax=Alcanivorax sp. S71-1-4 TaxID=1177159 RepID=UPI00135AFDED|nr:peptidylprolyl isomerase [Alcanivorax sp. S71-1-4]KAF0809930.1 peptidyl-prolyl cis-trans isomerase [Alcanivorax sp. S71-1-4]